MRNVFKMIKYLSLALCFGLFFNSVSVFPAHSQSFNATVDIPTSLSGSAVGCPTDMFKNSSGRCVYWEALSDAEKHGYASEKVKNNAINNDGLDDKIQANIDAAQKALLEAEEAASK